MGKDVESPNRFPLFSDTEGLFKLITHWQEITGKPVGIKVVAGDTHSFDELASYMKETGKKTRLYFHRWCRGWNRCNLSGNG